MNDEATERSRQLWDSIADGWDKERAELCAGLTLAGRYTVNQPAWRRGGLRPAPGATLLRVAMTDELLPRHAVLGDVSDIAG